jgi:integrase
MPKLTKRTVDAASFEGTGGQSFVWDSEIKGFGLRISRGGRKSYVFQYRNAQRRSRRLTLGIAARLTPDQARGLALQAAAAAERGEDPAEAKLAARRGPRFEEFAVRYLEEHARPKKKASSVQLDERLLKGCLLPALGNLTVTGITANDARRMHHAHRETPVQANRALLLLSKMMNLAESWGLRPLGSNPCRGVERYREKPRQRFLSAEEIARLGKALREVEAEGSAHASGILALRLLLLTGARVGEILSLRWAEVDFDRRCLHLADSKTGEKMIPLGAPALDLLVEAPRIHGNPYVCPGEREGKPLVGLTRIWYRIRERADLTDVRIHDLRHSFASVGAGGGIGLPILGAILGHTQPQTTHRYAHLAADPLLQAADHIATEIDRNLRGETAEKHQVPDEEGEAD